MTFDTASNFEIDVRKIPNGERVTFLIGPGGVGKSTLGRLLAAEMGHGLIDLDDVFCERIGNIGTFIRKQGADAYYRANSALALQLVAENGEPAVFVASSGFLAAENPFDIGQANRDAIGTGYGLSLLPSLDIVEATRIVVGRQLARGFGLKRTSEERKFRERFDLYRARGDMLVVASAITPHIAAEVAAVLRSSSYDDE